MSRPQRFEISALNVVLPQPHSPELYAKLFIEAVNLDASIKVAGDIHAKVVSCLKMGSENEDGLEGEVFRFIEIDPAAWGNLLKGKSATDEERARIVIPSELRPNVKRIRYAFFPKTHRLVAVTYSSTGSTMSIERLKTFFERLLNHRRLGLEHPVTLTVEQSPDTIEDIFSLSRIDWIEIEVKRPNADDDEDFEQELLEQMEAENVRKQKVKLVAEKHESIRESERIRKLAKVAVSNGSMVAKGVDAQDVPRQIDTCEHPRTETFYVRKNQEFLGTFASAARKLVGKILKS